mgnify:CR=1 FL=1
MTKFISNVNKYLSEMKIKQSYLSMVTGIDKNKMSRLLTGSQEESGTDMEKIARGLGKSIGFFLKESMSISQVGSSSMNNCILCWRTFQETRADRQAVSGINGKY